MKPSSERKKRYGAKLHQKRKYIHVHVSKELRARVKKRSVLVKKGDTVHVMRGTETGKKVKVSKVDYKKGYIYLEGISRKTMRGKEVLVPFSPSNVQLIEQGKTIDKKKEKKDEPKKVEEPAEKPVKEEKKSEKKEIKNIKKGDEKNG